jgi:hypothetical protein
LEKKTKLLKEEKVLESRNSRHVQKAVTNTASSEYTEEKIDMLESLLNKVL